LQPGRKPLSPAADIRRGAAVAKDARHRGRAWFETRLSALLTMTEASDNMTEIRHPEEAA
jgi:hypothetical protein